jgi:hypothetical protein
VNGFVTVETRTRWETSSLLRKLRGHRAHAIQVGRHRWLVRSPVGLSASVAELEEIVSKWAAEEGTDLPALHVDSERVVMRR